MEKPCLLAACKTGNPPAPNRYAAVFAEKREVDRLPPAGLWRGGSFCQLPFRMVGSTIIPDNGEKWKSFFVLEMVKAAAESCGSPGALYFLRKDMQSVH